MVKTLPDLKKNKHSRMKQLFGSRRNRMLVIVGVLVLVIVVAAAIIISQPSQDEQDIADMNALSEQSAALVADQKYGQAIGLWQAFLKRPLSTDVKCEANLRYGVTLLDSLKYNDAYENLSGLQESCKKLDKFVLTAAVASSAEGSARIVPAIDNYKKLIELEQQRQQKPPKDFNQEESDKMIADWQENIKILELNL